MDKPHYWCFCNHCDAAIVVCGRCGNNCCNGGYGEEIDQESGELTPCRLCPSAYKMNREKPPIDIVRSPKQ